MQGSTESSWRGWRWASRCAGWRICPLVCPTAASIIKGRQKRRGVGELMHPLVPYCSRCGSSSQPQQHHPPLHCCNKQCAQTKQPCTTSSCKCVTRAASPCAAACTHIQHQQDSHHGGNEHRGIGKLVQGHPHQGACSSVGGGAATPQRVGCYPARSVCAPRRRGATWLVAAHAGAGQAPQPLLAAIQHQTLQSSSRPQQQTHTYRCACCSWASTTPQMAQSH